MAVQAERDIAQQLLQHNFPVSVSGEALTTNMSERARLQIMRVRGTSEWLVPLCMSIHLYL